jgi:hypothetical protein
MVMAVVVGVVVVVVYSAYRACIQRHQCCGYTLDASYPVGNTIRDAMPALCTVMFIVYAGNKPAAVSSQHSVLAGAVALLYCPVGVYTHVTNQQDLKVVVAVVVYTVPCLFPVCLLVCAHRQQASTSWCPA